MVLRIAVFLLNLRVSSLQQHFPRDCVFSCLTVPLLCSQLFVQTNIVVIGVLTGFLNRFCYALHPHCVNYAKKVKRNFSLFYEIGYNFKLSFLKRIIQVRNKDRKSKTWLKIKIERTQQFQVTSPTTLHINLYSNDEPLKSWSYFCRTLFLNNRALTTLHKQ